MRRKLLSLIFFVVANLCNVNAWCQLSGFYQEDFEGAFPPAGWQVQNVLDSAYTWTQTTATHYSGTHSAYIHYSSSDTVKSEDWLILPQFSVSANDSFSFWLALQYVPYPPDSTAILVSTTDSDLTSFTSVLASLSQGSNYPGTANLFKNYKFSLSSFAGQNIYLALRNRNKDGDGVFIDLVSIGNPLQDQDAVAVSIDMLDYESTASPIIPKATVKNNSITEQSFSVTMTITGGYSSTKDVVNLASGATQQIDFDPCTLVAGSNVVTIQTQLSADEDLTNDTLSKVLTAFDPLSGFYQEDFEGAFPPFAWQVKDVLHHPNTWVSDNSNPYSGASSAFLMYTPSGVQGEDWLILPQFTVAATDSFSFWLSLPNVGFSPDSTSILISATDTYLSSFTSELGILSEGDNYPSTVLTYKYYSFSLADYAGQNIYVAFKNRNIWGDGVFVDHVSMGTQPVLNATALSIDSIPDYISTAVISPMATVQNNSNYAESFSVNLTATGGYSSTKVVINLAVGATQQITFDPWTPVIGKDTITLAAQLSGDTNPSDDSIQEVVSALDSFINYGWISRTVAQQTVRDQASASVNHSDGTSELFILGGVSSGFISDAVSMFDSENDSWFSLSPMPVKTLASCAAALNGKIYVIGGYNYYYTGDNQIYDIATNSWSYGASMPVALGDYAFGVYHDSLLYYIGGFDFPSATDYDLVQIYDPNSDSWTNGTHVPGAGRGWQAGIVGNKIVLSGGVDDSTGLLVATTYVGIIQASNPDSIMWTQVDDFPGGGVFRQSSGTCIDSTIGLVIFTGGDSIGSGYATLNSTLAYDVNSNSWKMGPDKPTAANNLRNLSCVVYNDSMYMASVGGYDGLNELDVNEWLNLGPAPIATGNTGNIQQHSDLSSYPNPFTNFTTLSFSLEHISQVRISIVDVLGKEVHVLLNKKLKEGIQQVTWNASGYSSGIYFCKINVNGNVLTQKLVKLN